ncbi:MAG: hypothetical protein V7646_6818 [Pseudonocardia sp.]
MPGTRRRSPTPPNTPAPRTRTSRSNSAIPPAPLDPRRRHRRRRSRRRLGPRYDGQATKDSHLRSIIIQRRDFLAVPLGLTRPAPTAGVRGRGAGRDARSWRKATALPGSRHTGTRVSTETGVTLAVMCRGCPKGRLVGEGRHLSSRVARGPAGSSCSVWACVQGPGFRYAHRSEQRCARIPGSHRKGTERRERGQDNCVLS